MRLPATIICASTLQIRYTRHNSGQSFKTRSRTKYKTPARTNANCLLDKYKIPTTGSLIDSARTMHTSLQRHPSSKYKREILEAKIKLDKVFFSWKEFKKSFDNRNLKI